MFPNIISFLHEVLLAAIAVVSAISWQVIVLILCWYFRKDISEAISRVEELDARFVKLVLKRAGREELKGLTPPDIWALDDFNSGKIATNFNSMNLAQRMAAVNLVGFGLLEFTEENGNQKVVASAEGKRILGIAKSLTLPAAR